MDTKALQTGCVLDGGQGWRNNYRIIDLARECGMPWNEADDENVVQNYRDDLHTISVVEAVDEIAVEALTYLNENVAAPGHVFEWVDGDLMYWTDAQSCVASGDQCQCVEPHDGHGNPATVGQ